MLLTVLLANIPTFLALIAYLVRFEVKTARMQKDIEWLKGNCSKCRLPLDRPSP